MNRTEYPISVVADVRDLAGLEPFLLSPDRADNPAVPDVARNFGHDYDLLSLDVSFSIVHGSHRHATLMYIRRQCLDTSILDKWARQHADDPTVAPCWLADIYSSRLLDDEHELELINFCRSDNNGTKTTSTFSDRALHTSDSFAPYRHEKTGLLNRKPTDYWKDEMIRSSILAAAKMGESESNHPGLLHFRVRASPSMNETFDRLIMYPPIGEKQWKNQWFRSYVNGLGTVRHLASLIRHKLSMITGFRRHRQQR